MNIPEEFKGIVKLSDEQFTEHESFENDDAPLKKFGGGDLFAADPLREALVKRLKELNDEEFLCLLTGWTSVENIAQATGVRRRSCSDI